MPISVYGSEIVPITIRVIGHVSPKVFEGIKNYTETDYYLGSYKSFPYDLKDFNGEQSNDIKYTKIKIKAPSEFLTEIHG